MKVPTTAYEHPEFEHKSIDPAQFLGKRLEVPPASGSPYLLNSLYSLMVVCKAEK